jgi:hypothetical protein
MTSRANKHFRLESSVQTPTAVDSLNAGYRFTEPKPSTRSLQEIVVEFTPPNSVTDRMTELDINPGPAGQSHSEPMKWLKHSPRCIIRDIQIQSIDDLRRDPPSANLISWKGSFVDNHHIERRLAQLPGTG